MLALTGGRVYAGPFEEPLRDATVLIRGAEIIAVGKRLDIPPGCEVLNCSGCTLVAGLWNSHVHFFERRWSAADALPAAELARQLEDFTRFGFTNVFDTGSMWENTRAIRERIESGLVRGPKIRSTGEAMLPPNAMPPDDVLRVLGFMPFPAPEISDEEEAVSAVKRLIAAGVDAIKIFASAQRSNVKLSRKVIEAVVREAHRAGKPVFVHPNTTDDIVTALQSGVDVIAHTTPGSDPWNETVLELARENNAALTPTLKLWKNAMRHDRVSIQDAFTNAAVEQLKAWRSAGGEVLFGTDVGAVDYDPAEEYELMTKAGMTFADTLASLTTASAKRFGDPKREGRLAEKHAADIVVLDGDPARDIRALSDVRYTIRKGKTLYGRSF